VTTYDGPAVIIVPGRGRCPVDAVLRTAELIVGSQLFPTWSGIARNTRPDSLFGLMGET
jgi:hypothetical protein